MKLFWISIIYLALAAYCDLKTKKIPNSLTVPIVAIGLIVSLFTGGFLASFIAITLLFFASMTGFLGMGDIKLLMGLTALSGPLPMILSTFFGSLVSLVYMLIRNREEAKEEIRKGLILFRLGLLNPDKNDKALSFAPFVFVGFLITKLLAIWEIISI